MAALERVLELKRQGKSEGEIINILKSENFSPLKISDALNQSKIKEAVADSNPTEGMSPSIMGGENQKQENTEKGQEEKMENEQENYYSPQPQEQPAYSPKTAPEENYSQTPPQQNYDPFAAYANNDYNQDYGEEMYSNQDYGGQYENSSTDTIIEISEQVFLEKTKNILKQVKELEEFKKISESKIADIDERLKRMEKNFDKMQLSILDKVSEYGKGLDYLRKEMNMVTDSMTKISKEK